ncbi:MAG: hypothetical protein AAF196_13505 [Planctomycetota bacterium]
MKTITVIRNRGRYGVIRKAKIMADRKRIGVVSAGGTVEVEIPAGTASLYVKMDWGRSNPFPVAELENGDTIYMNARFTVNPLRGLGIIALPIRFEWEPR